MCNTLLNQEVEEFSSTWKFSIYWKYFVRFFNVFHENCMKIPAKSVAGEGNGILRSCSVTVSECFFVWKCSLHPGNHSLIIQSLFGTLSFSFSVWLLLCLSLSFTVFIFLCMCLHLCVCLCVSRVCVCVPVFVFAVCITKGLQGIACERSCTSTLMSVHPCACVRGCIDACMSIYACVCVCMRVGASGCRSRDGRAPNESGLRQLRLLQPGGVNHALVVDEEKGETALNCIHGFIRGPKADYVSKWLLWCMKLNYRETSPHIEEHTTAPHCILSSEDPVITFSLWVSHGASNLSAQRNTPERFVSKSTYNRFRYTLLTCLSTLS